MLVRDLQSKIKKLEEEIRQLKRSKEIQTKQIEEAVLRQLRRWWAEVNKI